MRLMENNERECCGSGGDCLVARATRAVLKPPDKPVEIELEAKLNALTIQEKPKKPKKKDVIVDNLSPKDFCRLQNTRSCALAGKINTALKMQRSKAEIFKELLYTDAYKISDNKENDNNEEVGSRLQETEDADVVAKKQLLERNKKKSKKEKVESDGDLISRGPGRVERIPVTHHPYIDVNGRGYGAAPKRKENRNYYQNAYDNSYDWMDSPGSSIGYSSSNSSPGNCQTDMGYFSSSPQQQQSPFPNCSLNDVERILDGDKKGAPRPEVPECQPGVSGVQEEVPEHVSDFILKYSRRYSASNSEEGDGTEPVRHSRNSSISENSDKARPHSVDSGCCSPMSAGSAPHCSPNAPRGTVSGQPYVDENAEVFEPRYNREEYVQARDKLRALLSDKEYRDGIAWASYAFKKLTDENIFLDQKREEGDTLLHILVSNCDLAKIYAYTELLLKRDMVSSPNPVDVFNDLNETPLFKAIEYRCRPEVVTYFLALGANPNIQPMKDGVAIKDPPLHYAAANGMPELVEALCPKADLNMLNGFRLTAIACAKIKHGCEDKKTGRKTDNRRAIEILLSHGAHPNIRVQPNRLLLSEAFNQMNPEVCEANRAQVEELVYYDMPNQDYSNEQRYYQETQETSYANQDYGYQDYGAQPYMYN